MRYSDLVLPELFESLPGVAHLKGNAQTVLPHRNFGFVPTGYTVQNRRSPLAETQTPTTTPLPKTLAAHDLDTILTPVGIITAPFLDPHYPNIATPKNVSGLLPNKTRSVVLLPTNGALVDPTPPHNNPGPNHPRSTAK